MRYPGVKLNWMRSLFPISPVFQTRFCRKVKNTDKDNLKLILEYKALVTVTSISTLSRKEKHQAFRDVDRLTEKL